MKTRLLSLAAFAFAITSSFGQLVLHEPFNYADSGTNDQLIGQGAWVNSGTSSSSTVNDIVPSPFNATALGIPVQTGNAFFFRGGNADPFHPFTGITSGTVYWSSLISIDAWDPAYTPGTTGKQILSLSYLNSSGSYSYPAALAVLYDATTGGYFLGLTNKHVDASNPASYVATPYAFGTQHLVVLSYDLSTQTAQLWVDPSVPTNGTMTTDAPDVTSVNSSSLSEINGFFIRLDANANTPPTTIDELRIAKSWAEVVGQTATASVSSFELNNVKLYPNPVKNNLFISSNEINFDAVSIYTIDGKKVLNQNKIIDNTIDVSNLASGMYVVKLNSTDSDAVLTRKIIIE